MKNISFLPENFRFLAVKFSIYLNRRVFVMYLNDMFYAKKKKKRIFSPNAYMYIQAILWNNVLPVYTISANKYFLLALISVLDIRICSKTLSSTFA